MARISVIPSQKLSSCGFYSYIRLSFLICRYAGIFPVSGLGNRNSDLTRHTFKSFYTIIICFGLFVQFVCVIFLSLNILKDTFAITRFTYVVRTTASLISMLVIIRISRNWKKIIGKINAIEKSLPPIPNGERFLRIIKLIAFTTTFFGLLEQVIYLVYTIELVKDCFLLPGDSGLYIKSYFVTNYFWIFDYIPFNYFTAFIVKFSRTQVIFLLHFIDTLIAIVSLYLCHRFNVFNRNLNGRIRRLTKSQGRHISWPDLQHTYTHLVRLVTAIDRVVSPLVFVSYTNNLLVVGQQTFMMLNKFYTNHAAYNHHYLCMVDHRSDWETTLYLSFSLIFISLRMMTVSFLAAHIHTLSRKPLELLHTIPVSAYNYEFQRFMDQVHNSKVALSGFNLFQITRAMILKMLATLITYELVLFQNKK